MFSSVLIANRGLIQANCVRAVKELGCKAITVYATNDRQSSGVRNADEAHELQNRGGIPYMDIDQLVELAVKLKVDAVHPGYGFLAQNVSFKEKLRKEGIQVISPDYKADVQIEDKTAMREFAKNLGLPILPGSETLSDVSELKKMAAKIGYPVAMKATEGYGGIGIRVIERESEIESTYRSIGVQADRFLFNAQNVYLEKAFKNVRHIEFPVARDYQGNMVVFPERECTIQRRFQKLVTETPSSCLSTALRGKLKSAVELLLNRLDLSGFISVEFLYDGDQAYFLELNDYIQPSHSVTSMFTGVDMIREQVSIAAKNALTITQADAKPKGYAMGVFVSAEDADRGFVPSPGLIERLDLPYGDGVFSQTNVCSGDTVGTFYDPITALVMVREKTREKTIKKMKTALDALHIDGIRTSIPLMRALMQYPEFLNGNFDTTLITEKANRDKIYENVRTEGESQIAAMIAALSIQRDSNQQYLIDQGRRKSKTKIWDMANDWFSRDK